MSDNVAIQDTSSALPQESGTTTKLADGAYGLPPNLMPSPEYQQYAGNSCKFTGPGCPEAGPGEAPDGKAYYYNINKPAAEKYEATEFEVKEELAKTRAVLGWLDVKEKSQLLDQQDLAFKAQLEENRIRLEEDMRNGKHQRKIETWQTAGSIATQLGLVGNQIAGTVLFYSNRYGYGYGYGYGNGGFGYGMGFPGYMGGYGGYGGYQYGNHYFGPMNGRFNGGVGIPGMYGNVGGGFGTPWMNGGVYGGMGTPWMNGGMSGYFRGNPYGYPNRFQQSYPRNPSMFRMMNGGY